MRKIETYKIRRTNITPCIKVKKEDVRVVFADGTMQEMVIVQDCFAGAQSVLITPQKWRKFKNKHSLGKV